MMMRMIRGALLSVALAAAVCDAILPDIVNSGISHILEESIARAQPEQDSVLVEVEPQPSLESAHQTPSDDNDLPPSDDNRSASNEINSIEAITNTSPLGTTIIPAVQSEDLDNSIDQGCSTHQDCGKGKYCVHPTLNSKCLPCKTTDLPCVKDEECCDDQLCVWGQCTQNATKGEAGSTCYLQTDCNPELCCALHSALRFPVCSAKPIERERCLGGSNHLMALLSWDIKENGPRKHCPCTGNLRCQHLGRGSMCLKGEDSSEEELSDSLYSEIDYII